MGNIPISDINRILSSHRRTIYIDKPFLHRNRLRLCVPPILRSSILNIILSTPSREIAGKTRSGRIRGRISVGSLAPEASHHRTCGADGRPGARQLPRLHLATNAAGAQPEGSHHFGSRAGTRSRRAARARQAGDNAARVAGRTFTQHPHSDLACRHVRALAALDDRIAAFDAEFAAAARIDDAARRLMTVSGRRLKCDGSCRGGWRCTHLHWGPRSCRWLGIVPRRASTGGKPRLLGITKRGSKYLRKMLIQGGRTPTIGRRRLSPRARLRSLFGHVLQRADAIRSSRRGEIQA